MIGSATFFDLLFGWGFVVIAVLLVVFFFVVLRTMGSFKNADKAKGKIINLTDIGAQSLPLIEYEFKGEKLSFKTKTDMLQVQELNLLSRQLKGKPCGRGLKIFKIFL